MAAPARGNPTNPINWAELDDTARSGGLELVRNERLFALGRWDGTRWVHNSGNALGFEPTSYLKRERADG